MAHNSATEQHKAVDILDILDQSAEDFTFPMLDNGYVYLAASRLALFRSAEHWAIVFEIFGFSPRGGHPDLSIVTIANKLHSRQNRSDYVSDEAYDNYLKNNPYWESDCFWPISNEDWIDEDEPELVAGIGELILRGKSLELPQATAYAAKGINLEDERPAVFELCRYLAHDHRKLVLGTENERRTRVPPEMKQIMLLDQWHHPDLADSELPSQTKTFQQLAAVLEKNEPEIYRAPEPANNHWINWPEGGTL